MKGGRPRGPAELSRKDRLDKQAAKMRAANSAGKSERERIGEWITETLWSPSGWVRFIEDDFEPGPRNKAERDRIRSAVEFILRVLGNNPSPETQAVIESILAARARVQK